MKRYEVVVFVLCFVVAPVSANAETFLCGDPPPLTNESLKGELDGKAQFLSRFLGDVALKGNIETARSEVLSKYPNADKVVVDYYLLYQTCMLLMNDKSLSTPQKLEELRKMRAEFHSTFNTQKVYKQCRLEEFGQEGWASQETLNGASGWINGGSNPDNWCNQFIAQTVQGRSIGPRHKATVLAKSEEEKWTWDRRRLYNYHCTILMEWNPIYIEKQDPRCGER